MTKRSEDKAPSLTQVLTAALKAQHDQAERIQRGGALRVVENLSSADQRTVIQATTRR